MGPQASKGECLFQPSVALFEMLPSSQLQFPGGVSGTVGPAFPPLICSLCCFLLLHCSPLLLSVTRDILSIGMSAHGKRKSDLLPLLHGKIMPGLGGPMTRERSLAQDHVALALLTEAGLTRWLTAQHFTNMPGTPAWISRAL